MHQYTCNWQQLPLLIPWITKKNTLGKERLFYCSLVCSYCNWSENNVDNLSTLRWQLLCHLTKDNERITNIKLAMAKLEPIADLELATATENLNFQFCHGKWTSVIGSLVYLGTYLSGPAFKTTIYLVWMQKDYYQLDIRAVLRSCSNFKSEGRFSWAN